MVFLTKQPVDGCGSCFTSLSVSPQAEQVISTLRKDDESRRKELSKIFQDSLKTLEALDDYVLNHLISEGTIGDLQDDMTKYINNLETNECPILVAGEQCLQLSSTQTQEEK